MPQYQFTTSTAHSSRASSVQSDRRHFRESTQLLRPEDAFLTSPPKRNSSFARSDTVTANSSRRSNRDKRRGRSSSRRRNANSVPKVNGGQWKKLLWVKQSYPDNYTDEETFLDHLQRNPRLRPYEFWPLVADSTIIVQHICSVVIFVCCFTAIFQERVSPQTVVGWATLCTVAGWVFRDSWQSRDEDSTEDDNNAKENGNGTAEDDNVSSGRVSTEAEADFGMPFKEPPMPPLGFRGHSRNASAASSVGLGIDGNHSKDIASSSSSPTTAESTSPKPSSVAFSYSNPPSMLSPRMQERLTTAKSAILIYCSLLGLSPILKSLTLSTSSDSIWALSSWLLGLNIFTFDYGAGPEAKFPASLSTNAALMASTVLASRLPTTTHVFSLTLFSIEVFGLFPVFRRHLRHHSWTGHLWLTTALVILASGGLSMTISGRGWGMGILGVVLGGIICCFSMGMTSWWLIGLQRYKNEIHGPWDPARPVIRRHWD
ncbi:phosphatidylinositol N-acetylglucosaminyltransferase subunit C [Lecanosticta acicola]|uniref:Phosphatidylinositol N-acetylglucosaminyltransferase subunit C n=1 Tax=Lecanosticta acicola TaxID=111012 RepID=A0AAI8YPR8_9PEZI|nr:phosphatidylinositol N-acetylglucosaminyltransferase subunit C [Lecanosticta acicola]